MCLADQGYPIVGYTAGLTGSETGHALNTADPAYQAAFKACFAENFPNG